MPNYLVKQLQRVHVVNLNWLPTLKGVEYNISKLKYQGLSDKDWPSYLPVEIVTQKRTMRSNNTGPSFDHGEKHFKIKLKALSTTCLLVFDQMKIN